MKYTSKELCLESWPHIPDPIKVITASIAQNHYRNPKSANPLLVATTRVKPKVEKLKHMMLIQTSSLLKSQAKSFLRPARIICPWEFRYLWWQPVLPIMPLNDSTSVALSEIQDGGGESPRQRLQGPWDSSPMMELALSVCSANAQLRYLVLPHWDKSIQLWHLIRTCYQCFQMLQRPGGHIYAVYCTVPVSKLCHKAWAMVAEAPLDLNAAGLNHRA